MNNLWIVGNSLQSSFARWRKIVQMSLPCLSGFPRLIQTYLWPLFKKKHNVNKYFGSWKIASDKKTHHAPTVHNNKGHEMGKRHHSRAIEPSHLCQCPVQANVSGIGFNVVDFMDLEARNMSGQTAEDRTVLAHHCGKTKKNLSKCYCTHTGSGKWAGVWRRARFSFSKSFARAVGKWAEYTYHALE